MWAFCGGWLVIIALMWWVVPSLNKIACNLGRIANALEDEVYEDDDPDKDEVAK